jgi:sulfur-carrier protein
MIQVTLSGALKGAAGGKTVVEVEAANIQQMLARLGTDHPKLKPILEKGVSVSVNGQIYRDAWLQPIPPGSEVFILPKMAGG